MELEKILKGLGYTEEQVKGILDAMAAGNLHVSSVEKPEETIRQLQEEKRKLEKDNAGLKEAAGSTSGKAGETEAEVRRLQETVKETQASLQLVKALTKANAADVDYMLYQAEKSGRMKGIRFNDDGSLSGVDELVEGLKRISPHTSRRNRPVGSRDLCGQASRSWAARKRQMTHPRHWRRPLP